jgi:tetratricopeptide (TPR) repeat protein
LATAGKVLQAEPTRQRALKVKVETLICTRQYEEARQLILRALDQADDAVPFELLNLKLDAAVSHKSVLPAAERLAQAYPDRVEVLNTLAASQLENDQLPQAEKTLQKSYLLNPDDPQTLLAMGHIDRIQGNLDHALAHLSQAVQLDPSLIDAYLELGLTYQTRREVNKALETYHRAIQMVPKDARAYVQAAAAYKDSRDYHSAELMLREAAQISNNNPSIRRQLASVMALNLVNNLQEAPKRK